MQPTITECDEYERILALVEQGRIPATIPAVYNGTEGLWTSTFAFNPGRTQTDTEVLWTAAVAIRTAYKQARAAGAMTKI